MKRTGRLSLPRVLMVGVAVALLGAGPLSGVAAAHEEVGAHGEIAVSPGGDVGAPPTLSGRFEVSVLEWVDNISLSVSPAGPTRGGPITANGCALATAGKCGESKVHFSWTLPGLAYNGPYVVNATARHCLSVCVNPPTTAKVNPTGFRLAAPPQAPKGLAVEVADNGDVILSWAKNAEPDIIGYAVFRKAPGAKEFQHIGAPVPQPTVARARYVDGTTGGGGSYSYQVVAVRNGASGDSSTAIASGYSAATTANVPVPAPETTAPNSTVQGGQPVTTLGGAAAAGKQAPAGAASLNLSRFVKPTPPAPLMTTPTLPEIDNGFDPNLPFGVSDVEPGEEDTDQGLPAGGRDEEGGSSGRGPLIPVALGAIMLVLAMHVRHLNKRLDHPAPIPVTEGTDLPTGAEGEPVEMPVDESPVQVHDSAMRYEPPPTYTPPAVYAPPPVAAPPVAAPAAAASYEDDDGSGLVVPPDVSEWGDDAPADHTRWVSADKPAEISSGEASDPVEIEEPGAQSRPEVTPEFVDWVAEDWGEEPDPDNVIRLESVVPSPGSKAKDEPHEVVVLEDTNWPEWPDGDSGDEPAAPTFIGGAPAAKSEWATPDWSKGDWDEANWATDWEDRTGGRANGKKTAEPADRWLAPDEWDRSVDDDGDLDGSTGPLDADRPADEKFWEVVAPSG